MKVTEQKLKEGRELAKKHGFKVLFVNVYGEFFTNKSFALLSVGNDKDKIAEVELSEDGIRKPGAGSPETGAKATNDLGKASEVIEAIEVAVGSEAVVEIMRAEAEGKNRKSVIEAGKKKLDAIAQAAVSPALGDGKPETEDGNETTKND